jgi:hypothetical protein
MKEISDNELISLWVDGLKKDRDILKGFASYRIASGSVSFFLSVSIFYW